MGTFTESVVEEAALDWLESLGWTVKHGPEIAPGELYAERQDYGQVVLEDRLREALIRINPDPARGVRRRLPQTDPTGGLMLKTRRRSILSDILLPKPISGELLVKDA